MKRNYSESTCEGKSYFFLQLFLIALLGSQVSWGQEIQKQVIGSYPVMDGGFEGQVLGLIATSSGDIPHVTNWTQGGSVVANVVNTATTARSGSNCLSYSIATGGRYIQSPQITPTLTNSTDYIVQFYYKSSTNPLTNLNAALRSDAKRIVNPALSPAFTADTWLRASVKMSSLALTMSTTPWAGIRDGVTGTPVAGIIDDFVVYQSSVIDVTAPDPATAAGVAVNGTALDVSWTAPGTGVDLGGYVVVRYESTPNADNDPNVNGIYAVGNTITNGTAALTGKVVYIGTATSFQDATVVNSTNYYYKIYTVDKAFNYSAEVEASGTAPALGVNDVKQDANDIVVYSQDKNIKIQSGKGILSEVKVYDLQGRLVASKKSIGSNETSIALNVSKAVYVVKVTTADGAVVTKKIVQ